MITTSFSVVLLLPLVASAAPLPCETLAKFALPDASITLAQPVPAGEFTLPEGFRPGPGDPSAKALTGTLKLLPVVLPCRGHAEAHCGFRHQSGVLDARDELEPEI